MVSYVGMKAQNMGFVDAHLTVHYLGKYNLGRYDSNSNIYRVAEFITKYAYKDTVVEPKRIEMFGPNKDIPVVTVDVFGWLRDLNSALQELHPSPSEYPWNPHITLPQLGYVDVQIPKSIKLTELSIYL